MTLLAYIHTNCFLIKKKQNCIFKIIFKIIFYKKKPFQVNLIIIYIYTKIQTRSFKKNKFENKKTYIY